MLVYADSLSKSFMHKYTHGLAYKHTYTVTQKLSLRSSSTPSCSQALKIGLTGITLSTLPIQLDYTSDSAFIHLYCTQTPFTCTHMNTHTPHSSNCHSAPISIILFARACHIFVAQSALCALLPAGQWPFSAEALVTNRMWRNRNSVIRLLCPSVQFNLCFVYGH